MSITSVATRADAPGRRRGSSRTRRLGRLLRQGFAWVVILGVLGVLMAAVLVPRLGGATPYTILTGSMTPGLPPGTLVVSKPVAPERISVGSVITYQRVSGRSEVVTHRVVEVGADGRGELRWRTQGDANPAVDQDWVRPAQVKGQLWYAVPYLGRLNLLLSADQRQVAVTGTALLLFGYAAVLWLRAARDRWGSSPHPLGGPR